MSEIQKSLEIRFAFFSKRLKEISWDYPWISWTSFYSSFLLIAFAIAFIFTNFLNQNHTDVNSARYLLSALVQSEASILAIVITLTLVAVQLSAASYTPRVSKIFIETPHMYLILAIYIFSIAYGAILLQLINGTEGSVPIQLEFWISGGYWLCILLVVALIPYIYYTLELFRPDLIIERISRHLTKEQILQNDTDSSLASIFDILINSIVKYDTTTIRRGLVTTTHQIMVEIANASSLEEKNKIIAIYCTHLERCARKAIELHDEEILEDILNQFEMLGNDFAKNKMEVPTRKVIETLIETEKLIAAEDIPLSLDKVGTFLGSMGLIAIENNFRDTFSRILFSQEIITKHAIQKINPLDEYSFYFLITEDQIGSITNFIKKGISQGQLYAVNLSLHYLRTIGIYSLKLDNLYPLYSISNKILDIWEKSIPNVQNSILFLDTAYLAYFAKKETIKKYGSEGTFFERKVIDIGTKMMDRSTEPEIRAVATFLADLRLIDDNNFQYEIQHNEPKLPEEQLANYKKFLALQETIYQEKNRNKQIK